MVEAGHGDIKGERDNIPWGWELIWVADPWTGRCEKVRVPQEEADYRHRRGLPPKPSYRGESEAREWQRCLREENEVVEREEQERRAWSLEEACWRRYLLGPETPTQREMTL